MKKISFLAFVSVLLIALMTFTNIITKEGPDNPTADPHKLLTTSVSNENAILTQESYRITVTAAQTNIRATVDAVGTNFTLTLNAPTNTPIPEGQQRGN